MSEYTAKKLFTPGPLCVSDEVKRSMLVDLGSRDDQFITCVREVREGLMRVAQVCNEEFTCVLLQGSGTYCVEAVLQTTLKKHQAKVLVLVNGAYGRRITSICERIGVTIKIIDTPEHQPLPLEQIESTLRSESGWSLVAMVHCETSTGVINPVEDVAKMVRQYSPEAAVFVDAMSSFGAVPLNLSNIDYMVSSSNKCLEGVPGFSYAFCRLSHLLSCKGQCSVLSLDLVDQHINFEKTGQFRFTPPTHSIVGFKKALDLFWKEGGLNGRNARYTENKRILINGMENFGFKRLVLPQHDGPIITSFKYPQHKLFNFDVFYQKLSQKGQVIYPGKVSEAATFRIGNIGHIFPQDIHKLIQIIQHVLRDMQIPLPL